MEDSQYEARSTMQDALPFMRLYQISQRQLMAADLPCT